MKKIKTNNLMSYAALLILILVCQSANAAVIDADSDGLIEINNLDDLNAIRQDLTARTFRGNTDGCPASGCVGWELTRDLDFDSNKNGELDSGDWNSGFSWKPFAPMSNVIFEGNSHSILNVLINTPDVLSYTMPDGSTGGEYRYGLFSSLNQSAVRNLRLLKPTIAVDGSVVPSNHIVFIGTLSARADDGSTINLVVSDASVNFNRNANLQALRPGGRIGGIVGQMMGSAARPALLDNLHFDGRVQVDDPLSLHVAGGIAGQTNFSSIANSSAHGNIVSTMSGGVIGFSNESDLFNTYSTASVVGSTNAGAGGLIGQTFNSLLHNTYSSGTVTGGTSRVGGLIGLDTSTTILLSSSFSNSVVNTNQAQLIGSLQPNAIILNTDTYQVIDPFGIALPSSASSYTRSINQDDLECATNPISSVCTNPQAVASWDPTVWYFGSSSELPVLAQATNFPWASVDKPNSGQGDYESINDIRRNYPEFACDTPIDFQVKEKRTGYVFSAKTPEKFDFFNAKQGLQCTASAQIDGRCNNYEVSYLCDMRAAGGYNYWTNWTSSSNPVGGASDIELINNSICSGGTTIGIRARDVSNSTEYFGAPQKPTKFTLGYGFGCKNSDNSGGCKDYEARMVCNVKTLLTNP